jgi:tRNA(Ile)-lysidine synthase
VSLFTSTDKVLCSFSAGPDSVFLIHYLARHYPQTSFILIYFDHGLRPEEIPAEKKLTQDYAAQLGIECRIKSLPVGRYSARYSCSVETAARALRRKFLAHYAQLKGCTAVVTAHHQDDNHETFLLQLLRGSQAGLQGILADTVLDTGMRYVRPLLHLSKKEILEWLQSNTKPFCTDSSNLETVFVRNKIRHRLMPILQELEPSYRKQFDKTIAYLQNLHAEMDVQVEPIIQHTEILKPDLVALPHTFQKHAIMRWLQKHTHFSGTDKHVQQIHVENVMQLLPKAHSKVQIPGGYVVQVKKGKINLLFLGDMDYDKIV